MRNSGFKVGPQSMVVSVLLLGLMLGQTVARADEKTYEKAIHSAAWIISPTERGNYDGLCAYGTAVVKDTGNHLLVTAYHVVGNREQVLVFFPAFDSQGRTIVETAYYVTNRQKLGIEGKVVWRDPGKDLALIQLPWLPTDVVAIKTAANSPKPAQTIYAIGNSGFQEQVLWRPTQGIVRQNLRNHAFPLVSEGSQVPQLVQCDLLEAQLAINGGDSGGPVVNEAGELVGICSSVAPKQSLVSYVIDVHEVNAVESSFDREHLRLMQPTLQKMLKENLDLQHHLVTPMPSPFVIPKIQPPVEEKTPYTKYIPYAIAGVVVLAWLNKK